MDQLKAISLVLLPALALASVEGSYAQKLDCVPGISDCGKDYPTLEPPPDLSTYEKERLAPGLGLAIGLILICCVVWWCWCCCRCFARLDCCGCCRMTLCQCCCGAGTPVPQMVYTRCNRATLMIALIVAFLMLVAGGIAGWIGGHRTYDGGLKLADQALLTVDDMEDLNVIVAKNAFLSLGKFYDGDVTYDDEAVSGTITDVRKLISDAKDAMKSINDIFIYALPGVYGVFTAVTLFGCFAWICGIGCCSMTMGMCSSVLLLLAWLLFAVFWVTGSFLDDTCVELAEHYSLDCMKQPGHTCPQSKLTDLFKCPKLTDVSQYYADAFNLLDTAASNGAGTNAYGSEASMINKGYSNTTLSNHNKYGTAVTKLAPSAVSGEMGMEPYTTCTESSSFNTANVVGKRGTTCTTGGTNADQVGPQNAPVTVSGYSTTGLTAVPGSTNPPWAPSEIYGRGDKIGSCERACLNNTATSGVILDSLTNFGGNSMFRKFVYETFTSVYSSGNQGYAKCSADIKWKDNTAITNYAIYQNSSAWMTVYSNMATTGAECVSSTHCTYEYSGTNREIPWTAAGGTNPACYQAAAMAAADILFALSYIGSCQYIKTLAKKTAMQEEGACHTLGDGLVYLITAQGLIGVALFITTVVGVMGYRRFDSDNDAANKKPENTPQTQGQYEDAGFSANDDGSKPYDDGVGPQTEMTSPGVQRSRARTHDAWV